MMLGKSRPEYVFILTAITALQLVTPFSTLFVAWAILATSAPRAPPWTPFGACVLVYASMEVVFFTCIYLPRRALLQTAAKHPGLSRDARQALFARCAAHLGPDGYPAGWFFGGTGFRRDNVVEWLLWALFSTSMRVRAAWAAAGMPNGNGSATGEDDGDEDGGEDGNEDKDRDEDWDWDKEEELAGYVHAVERALERTLPTGYDPGTACMRLTLDPVRTVHRPLVWYLIVGVVDAVTCLRLYWHGFRHYSDGGRSFPPRLITLFSRRSSVRGLSYWYRPHRACETDPVLFLHGIGIGLFPYSGFLIDLAHRYPGTGILVPEFLSISARITAPPLARPALVRALTQMLDAHEIMRTAVAAHSFGTVVYAQVLHTEADDPSSLSARFAGTLLMDPIPLLLHLPDVAYNFVYRFPRTANEWLLWYFSSRDPDVAGTLGRHFFWAENVLWREELRGREVAVVLSGQDQVVNAPAVRRYLTGGEEGEYWRAAEGGLEVWWFGELDHAMVFNKRARWRSLLGVMDRFVRV